MAPGRFSIEEKIRAVDVEINEARKFRREPGSAIQRHYEVLKAVAADLRARQHLPRNNTLGRLERELSDMTERRAPEGAYQPGHLVKFANTVISRWPTISQALEQFGEESAE